METGLGQLRKLIADLREVTFWDRLFRWARIKNQLIDANADLQKASQLSESLNKITNELIVERSSLKSLNEKLADTKADDARLREQNTNLSREKEDHIRQITDLQTKNQNFLKRGTELSSELQELKQTLKLFEAELARLKEENSQFRASEKQQKSDHDRSVAQLHKLRDDLLNEAQAKKEKEYQQELERINKQKETWKNHETMVMERIKTICNKHTIEYVTSVPFKGKPDNTIKINNEYIIFDAKSPAGQDLSNFPTYLNTQAENASKYIKEEEVRREVFLVVPTNTLEIVRQFEYRLSDYTVYIVSIDSLEPIMLALRKIEDYEFAEQLSPEERENICRVIGKFVHLSKRRIQIDGFFAKQFFELVYRSEADLPKDFLDRVIEFERSEKLNPPIERRARQISNKELEFEIRKSKADAEQKGIEMDEVMVTKNLNKLPLYLEKPKEESQGDLFDK